MRSFFVFSKQNLCQLFEIPSLVYVIKWASRNKKEKNIYINKSIIIINEIY